jgi:hypothetical protein
MAVLDTAIHAFFPKTPNRSACFCFESRRAHNNRMGYIPLTIPGNSLAACAV